MSTDPIPNERLISKVMTETPPSPPAFSRLPSDCHSSDETIATQAAEIAQLREALANDDERASQDELRITLLALANQQRDAAIAERNDLLAINRGYIADKEQLQSALDAVTRERERLLGWKESQMQVEQEWNPQSVAKLLGITPGRSIRANIAPKIRELLADKHAAIAERDEARSWTDEDKPILEDEAIKQAHPLVTGKDETYTEALRMVGAKRSKYALVDLVNWLLSRIEQVEHERNARHNDYEGAQCKYINTRNERDSLASQLDAERKANVLTDAAFVRTRTELDKTQKAVDVLQSQLDKANSEVEDLKSEREGLWRETASLNSSIDALNARVRELEVDERINVGWISNLLGDINAGRALHRERIKEGLTQRLETIRKTIPSL